MEATKEWKISQVQDAVQEKLKIPVHRQTLLKGIEILPWEATLRSLMPAELADMLQLTLLVEEVPEPKPGALLRAIKGPDEAMALQLLRIRRPQLPGLNDLDQMMRTVLHYAIDRRLPGVALRTLARPDFLGINVKNRWGWTALHCAAERGFLQVCQGILSRADFEELLTRNDAGETAEEVARQEGHEAVAELLQRAESQI